MLVLKVKGRVVQSQAKACHISKWAHNSVKFEVEFLKGGLVVL